MNMEEHFSPISGFPVIQTKLMIPAVRDRIVHRSEMIQKIESGIKHGFVLVCSPPGYGKTTLISDWAQQHEFPVAWISLDADDNDLLTINRYFRIAITKLFDIELEKLQPNAIQGDAKQNLYVNIVAIINGCVNQEGQYTLVLDDYQCITNPMIHEAISYLLDHYPPNLRLIIASRKEPPFPLKRLIANQKVCFLDSNNLQFSREEVEEFLRVTLEMDVTDRDIERFYKRTEGWIAGVQLTALSRNQLMSPYLVKGEIVNYTNLPQEYILEEVFDKQPEEIQNFLLRTSILVNLCASLCDFVLFQDEKKNVSQTMLEQLVHSNLFLTNLDESETWFRYHPLFAESIQSLLKNRFADELPLLYHRASEWCKTKNLYDEALMYAFASEDADFIIKSLEKLTLMVLNRGTVMDVFSWVKKADDAIIKESPLLALANSWGLIISFEFEDGKFWLETAKNLLEAEPLSDWLKPCENDLWGMFYEIKAMLFAINGDYDQSHIFSEKAFQYLPEENSFSRSFALLNQAITLSLHGDTEDATNVIKKSLNTAHASGNWISLIIANCYFGELLISRGMLSKALPLFQQTIKFTNALNHTVESIDGFLYKKLGEIYLMKNQLEEANELIMRGSQCTMKWFPAINKLDNFMLLIRFYQGQRNYKLARAEIKKARAFAYNSQGDLDDLIIDLYEMKLEMLMGNETNVDQWLAVNQLSCDEDGFFSGMPRAIGMSLSILQARSYFMQGCRLKSPERIQAAIEMLENIIQETGNLGVIEYHIEALVLLAMAYLEIGESADSFEMLKSALKTAEGEEIRQVFVDEGLQMTKLLTQYISHIKNQKSSDNVHHSFVLDLLFRITGQKNTEQEKDKDIPGHGNDVDILIELLTTRECEVLSLVAEGRTNKDIALQLHLSVNTVKRHMNNIFVKLGVVSRTQAVSVARNQGLI